MSQLIAVALLPEGAKSLSQATRNVCFSVDQIGDKHSILYALEVLVSDSPRLWNRSLSTLTTDMGRRTRIADWRRSRGRWAPVR